MLRVLGNREHSRLFGWVYKGGSDRGEEKAAPTHSTIGACRGSVRIIQKVRARNWLGRTN